MDRRLPLFVFTLGLLAVSAPVIRAANAASEPSTLQILQSVKQATGDARWDAVRTIVRESDARIDGIPCHERYIADVRDGRWSDRTRCPVFSSAEGVDASGAWRQDRSGQVHPLNSAEAKKLETTDRWLERNGPLFPQRGSVQLERLAARTEAGKHYDRIRATPEGGRSVVLWIDRARHLLARTVMLRSFQTQTVRYSDYRRVDGVLRPFRIAVDVGDPAQADVYTVQRYRVSRALPAHALQRPSGTVTDVHFAHGAQTSLPLLPNEQNLILVQARINGKGPFPFILDTGGHAILTPETAKQLGLDMHGAGVSYGAGGGSTPVRYTRVDSMTLGDARIDRQSFLVLPMSPAVTDRGDQPPIAGLLGLEVLERFAVDIDFKRKQMTLQAFTHAKPPSGATVLPLRFTDDMPLIDATLDGKAGTFGIDTGNSGPLMLFPQWAERHGLTAYYNAGLAMPSGGLGGTFTVHSAYIRSLRLGARDVHGDLVGLLTPEHAGATSNPSEAGNLGMSVWHHFRIRFDYRRMRLYLTPRPDTHRRAASPPAVSAPSRSITPPSP